MTADYLKPQPAPAPGAATPTWEHVVEDCRDMHFSRESDDDARVWLLLAEDGAARDAFGAGKYGTRHQHDNGRNHAVDAYQEAMDGALYWRAEHLKTQSTAALNLYWQALRLAFDARAYLLTRDGR